MLMLLLLFIYFIMIIMTWFNLSWRLFYSVFDIWWTFLVFLTRKRIIVRFGDGKASLDPFACGWCEVIVFFMNVIVIVACAMVLFYCLFCVVISNLTVLSWFSYIIFIYNTIIFIIFIFIIFIIIIIININLYIFKQIQIFN